ncbi:Serine/threonine protein kinase prp4 [Entamoeba marina]
MFHPFQFVSSSHTTVSNTPVLLCSTTINYAAILNHINPSLNFATSKHPLTQPSIPAHNNGKDNEQYDYIVQTDEIIGSATSKEGNKCSKIKNSRYQVLSLLGSGTFGQKVMNGNGQYDYQLLTPQEYAEQNNVPLLPNRKYYRYTSLNEICSHFPLHHHGGKKGSDNETRLQIYDLLSHIFVFDPHKRIKPYEAMNHSFFGQSTNSFTTEQHIPKLPSMPEIVHHIFNQPVSLLYLQKQNYNIENYYQTYLKALYSGYVLNPLHVNPFHYQPLRGGLHFNVSLFKPHSDLDNDELPSIQIRSRCKSVSTSNEMEELPPISLNPVLPLNSPTINPAINYNFNSQSINNTHPNFATPTNTLPSGPTLRTPRANSSLKPPKRCPRQNSFSACSFKTAF